MRMKAYLSTLYDRGYEAPRTGGNMDRVAILEMDPEEGGHMGTPRILMRPPEITLRLEMRMHFYDHGASMERILNGRSCGKTPLYQKGIVLRDGSENLKPLSKVRAVDFIYGGRGFYWDENDMRRPFYEGHPLAFMIQSGVGSVMFTKPFAGTLKNVVLETQFHRQARDEWTDVVGFGRDTYPLYPYGGYGPPQGLLTDMEQVYFLPSVDLSVKDKGMTALKLYRSSFFHTHGSFPPAPFSFDHKTWVFPEPLSPLEQMNVGQALCEGQLTFQLKEEGGDVSIYRSYGYEQVGGSLKMVYVHCCV